MGDDFVLLVIALLCGAAAIGLIDRRLHRSGHGIGEEHRLAVDVARGAAHGLNQRCGGSEESLLIGVKNRHKRYLRQIQSFAQQVDPDERVKLTGSQRPENLDPLERLDLGMKVANAEPHFRVILRQVLRHSLGQRRDQNPFVAFGADPNLLHEGVHLAGNRPDLQLRISEPGGTDELLDDRASGFCKLVGTGCCRNADHLICAMFEFGEIQRPVVQGGREAEAVLYEGFLARAIAIVHSSNLRDRGVRLVYENVGVSRQIVEKRRRRLAR